MRTSYDTKNRKVFWAFLFLLAGGLSSTAFAQTKPVSINSNTFGAIEARHIGPAVMSGRVSAIDAQNSDPRIVYVGAASGGVWKSKNNGVTFKPVFDENPQSIGTICIDQNKPETVWVGTGEPWVRNSTSVGKGIYKTINGGESWNLMGLEETERIAKIIVHPENSDVIFVAAMGHLWGANEERGIYKSTNGGENWEKVLYIDENTGCTSITMDAENPNILYAGMWDFRRKAYTFRSGGPGSGLYKSTDGGANWKKIEKDMPEGTLGRITVACSPAKAGRVWALIESENSALYRSDDQGASWEELSTAPAMGERPFYFSNLTPDPVDPERIYKPSYTLNMSNDGGKTFINPMLEGGNVHVDMHALWVNPENNEELYLGTDGGMYSSVDRGNTFRAARNLPLAQFYHISADNEKPYNVMGGLQDNGSWVAPSRKAGGISNADWKNIGGGDGFNVFADLKDDNVMYWQYQGGNIMRYHKNTTETKQIRPFAENANDRLRYHWNTPIHFGANSGDMYVGAQYLYRSSNQGDAWTKISPDLTTNDPTKLKQAESGGVTIDNTTAENHCTLFSICESPLDRNLIWTGSDDGQIQVTTDGGRNWTNTTPNVSGLPATTWVSSIWASKHDKNTAYATFDGHRNDDKTAHVYKTTDLGKTWTSLRTGDIESYCHKVIQDPVNPNLLYLGTEMGLYVSFEDGKNWVRFKGKIPKVSIRDMVIQERENDLVLGTHGRGVLIVDDLTPLREISDKVMNSDVAFLKARPNYISNPGFNFGFSGDQEFSGENPSNAATITYYLKKRHVFGDMFLEIYDPKGDKIVTLPVGKRKGINRVNWTTRKRAPKLPVSKGIARGAIFGPSLPAGTYTAKMIKKDTFYTTKIVLEYPKDSPYSLGDRQVQIETVNKAYNLIEELSFLDRQLTEMIDQSGKIVETTEKENVKTACENFKEQLLEYRKTLVATNSSIFAGEERLRERLAEVYGAVASYSGRPTKSQIDRINAFGKEMDVISTSIGGYQAKELVALNTLLTENGLEAIKVIDREAYELEMSEEGSGSFYNENHYKGTFMKLPQYIKGF